MTPHSPIPSNQPYGTYSTLPSKKQYDSFRREFAGVIDTLSFEYSTLKSSVRHTAIELENLRKLSKQQ